MKDYELWIEGVYQTTGNIISITSHIAHYVLRHLPAMPLRIELLDPHTRIHHDTPKHR